MDDLTQHLRPHMPNSEPARIEDAFSSDLLDVLRRFVVDDLTQHLRPQSGQVILLFESPHSTEVIARHPLAGKSGLIVFKAFCPCVAGETNHHTMGEVLRCRLFDEFPCFRHLGVMNVSRLPLQEKPYPSSVRRKLPSSLLRAFGAIRSRPKVCANKRRTENRPFARLIYRDLQTRITEIRHRLGAANVNFVACGELAKAYLRVHLRVPFCHELSHPVAGDWNSPDVVDMVRWYRSLAPEH